LFCLNSVRFGSVRLGNSWKLVRFGSIQFEHISVRFGSVRFGSVRFGIFKKLNRFGSVWKIFDLFRFGSKKIRTDPTSDIVVWKIIESSVRVQLFPRSLPVETFSRSKSLCAYMYSSMLYPTMKSDSSMSRLDLSKNMFVKIGAFLPVKNYRINIIISLFLHQDDLQFCLKDI
jgi:hypothetical protein